MLLLLLLTGCVTEASQTLATEGQLDLTNIDFHTQTVSLSGDWELYWGQLLSPFFVDQGEFSGYVSFPSSWNRYVIDGENLPGEGYATYRLTFLSAEEGILGVKIPKVRTAYKLYINNQLVASAGTVGTSKETMVAQYLPQIAFFNADEGQNEIVLQVSNYYMSSGGLLSDIEIGSANNIQALREKKLNYSILLFGALMIMGFYHLAMFLFRKNDYSSLYFGLFCLMTGVRTLMTGESYFYTLFPDADFTYFRKIQTILFYLGSPMIIWFFSSILADYFHEKIVDLSLYVALIFSFLILFVPLDQFSTFNTIYQVWCLFLMTYMLTRLIVVISHQKKGTYLVVFGGLVLIFTTFVDIISLSVFVNDSWPAFLRDFFQNDDYSSTGQLIFVISYSLHLAKMFSDSLEYKTQINRDLDEIVLKRTEALTVANALVERQKVKLEQANADLERLSTHDPLTGLWNRRKYDEVMAIEWKRCLRYNHPISVIFIDIDYFKNYNDAYGHLAGDDCLVQIADILKSSLSRSTDMAVRYGGEEFVILLPETNKNEALKTAHMLLEKIEGRGIPHCQSLVNDYVTVSIGVSSMVPSLLSSPEKLVAEADAALYQAKNNGRNQVQYS
ncbi:diguanylate cyclase [Eubacteriaceae bacterium ES2]|nr:diguanylate cyclase [Eubacteriaceae bacterium ES2]